jgi:uncharacterized protein (TIGR02996 family)
MNPHDPQLLVFLREIKDRPDDDLPRLVLGDWLTDRGDPRGEFIHLQVRRSRLPEDDPDSQSMRGRERTLLRKYALDWLGPLADFGSGWSFERGFVNLEVRGEVRPNAEAPDLSRTAEALWVEGVTVRAKGKADLSILSRSGLLARLCRLDLSGLAWTSLAPLFAGEAAGLRSLSLSGSLPLDQEVRRLAEAAILSRLRALDLSCNRLYDDSAFALAASGPLRNLSRLDVSENRLTAAGRDALAAAFGDRVVLQRSRREVC